MGTPIYSDGVHQGLNGTQDIQVDQFRPFARPRMSQIWPYGGQNRLKIAFWPHKWAQRAYFGLEGWNKLETPIRKSRLISLGHLPLPECPNSGQPGAKKRPKQAKISPLATQISSEGIFWDGRGGTRFAHQCKHPDRPVGAICHIQNVPNLALRQPKRGQNRVRIAFWPNKLVQRAYFGLEGAERGQKTKEVIQTDQFGPFASSKMSQIGWKQSFGL